MSSICIVPRQARTSSTQENKNGSQERKRPQYWRNTRTGRAPRLLARPRYHAGDALVSVIIPFRDRVDLLDLVRRKKLSQTTFPNYELLLVNNQSAELETDTYLRSLAAERGVRIIRYDKPFNYSRLNNFAARLMRGEIFLSS